MKKILIVSLFVFGLLYPLTSYAAGYGYLDAPNGANRNFSGLMQHQFEKEETLNFTDNPEEYKAKRERKDAYLDYKEGKTEMPEFLKPNINLESTRPVSNRMEFAKDENGQIKIQGIK